MPGFRSIGGRWATGRSAGSPLLCLAGPALVLFLSGCGNAPEGEPLLVLGRGQQEFRPLEPGQPVPLHQGPQGGWHLWTSLRAGGIARRNVRLALERWPTERGRPVYTSYKKVDLQPVEGEPLYELVGWLTVLHQPECHVDEPLTLRAELTDRRGTMVSRELVIVPSAGPDGAPGGTCTRQ